MKLTLPNGSLNHLSYCSNIHPGETWQQIRENLENYLPGIRKSLNPDGDFGIGLRLSAAAVKELSQPEAMADFRAFLEDNHLYVFTLNGFPYGAFHGTRVKEDVYLPDWQDGERLRYTNELADVFAQFLPAGMTGSISTVPGAFKTRVNSEEHVRTMASNMVSHVAYLQQVKKKTGRHIVLALEPEPCCFLETIDECVEFFSQHLFSPTSEQQLCAELEITPDKAASLLREHLTVCLDLCHAAVEFEDYDSCIDSLRSAGITIGKLQISSGLRLEDVNQDTVALLRPFEDNVYLHQVVERQGPVLRRFSDLNLAFEGLNRDAIPREWRVHFHVPVFLDKLGSFSSTQFFLREALEKHRHNPVSEHLEVETYTWTVLPEEYRQQSMDKAIVRELQWVMDRLS